jgi:hypothetical protein
MSILEITSSQINYMHRKNLTSLTPSQRIELASLIKKYTKKPGVLHQHMEWHMANGSGGTTGPGSGERFLAFHRNYIGKLEDWIKTQVSDDKKLKKFVPLPKWRPSTRIPIQFAFPGRLTDNPKIKTPTWLTIKGGTTSSPEFGRKSLGKFNTSDELGREIGLNFHGDIHNTVGGVMATHSSPRDPIFFPWHSYLDDIWSTWETS